MIIEEGIATFTIKVDGDVTKNTYIGTFKVHCVLNSLDEVNSGKLYRELLGKNLEYATEREKNTAFALSQLKYRIVEEAPFWTHPVLGGSDIKDLNIIEDILGKAIEAQESYVKIQNEEYKKRQEILSKLIKSKTISRDEEVINPHEDKEPEIEV